MSRNQDYISILIFRDNIDGNSTALTRSYSTTFDLCTPSLMCILELHRGVDPERSADFISTLACSHRTVKLTHHTLTHHVACSRMHKHSRSSCKHAFSYMTVDMSQTHTWLVNCDTAAGRLQILQIPPQVSPRLSSLGSAGHFYFERAAQCFNLTHQYT